MFFEPVGDKPVTASPESLCSWTLRCLSKICKSLVSHWNLLKWFQQVIVIKLSFDHAGVLSSIFDHHVNELLE